MIDRIVGAIDARAIVRIAVGTAVGALALWLTFRGVDLHAVLAAVGQAHAIPVAGALLMVAMTVVIVSLRWRALLFPGGAPAGSLPRIVAAIVASQMLNVLLPIRLGEFGRAYWISRADRLPLARVVATIVIERIVDVVMLGVSVTVLLASGALPDWAMRSAQLVLGISVLTALVVAAAALLSGGVAAIADAVLRRLPLRAGRFVSEQARIALEEIPRQRTIRQFVSVAGLSAIIVACAAASNYVLFFAFDLRLSPLVALALFVVLQIGGAPVATPGNLGVFHYLTVLVLTAVDVERPRAVAYALVLHAVAVGWKILAGALVLASGRTPLTSRPSQAT